MIKRVLILILLEMRLLEATLSQIIEKFKVLILILLEMRLLDMVWQFYEVVNNSLNPYSTGNEVVGAYVRK